MEQTVNLPTVSSNPPLPTNKRRYACTPFVFYIDYVKAEVKGNAALTHIGFRIRNAVKQAFLRAP